MENPHILRLSVQANVTRCALMRQAAASDIRYLLSALRTSHMNATLSFSHLYRTSCGGKNFFAAWFS